MNDRRSALVSVGIPVFNGGSALDVALRSILNQTYNNLEVIVSDNASTDNTVEVCSQICAEDPRVDFVQQPFNLGPLLNFRAVLDRAQGEYFMWLGHDDWLSPNYIDECVRTLDRNPDVSLACGEAVYFHRRELSHRGVVVQLWQDSPQDRVLAYYSVVEDNGTFYGLMRRQQLVRVRMLNVMGGDWLLIAAIAFLGKVVTLPTTCVNRELGGSTESYTKIAASLGIPDWHGAYPHIVTALSVFREIAWRDPVYSLGKIRRLQLAWACQRIVRSRHNATVSAVLRRNLHLARHDIMKRIKGSPPVQ